MAKLVGVAAGAMVLLFWYWPLAALLIGQGWRSLDIQTWRSARLDAGWAKRFMFVTLPLLRQPLMLAAGVCFVLVLSEFATFHLAGINTLGTELAVLYQQTFSAGVVARAAWPLAAVAACVGVALWRRMGQWSADPPLAPIESTGNGPRWAVLAVLWIVSIAAPVALLVAHFTDAVPLRRFWLLHWDGLAWSALSSGVAGAVALVMAAGVLAIETFGRLGRWLGGLMTVTILVAMLLPGSVVGVAILELAVWLGLPAAIRQG
ncbi:MAG: hypothetical protein HQ546_02970, partial [Planctomycetes bacterium]|nr:hypothetical protein [Planctomycetota bacterium]